MRSWLLAAMLWGMVSGALSAQVRRLDGSEISTSEIDRTVSRLMSAAEVTGVGIAILNNGRIVHLKAYGFRDVEEKRPLTPESVMGAASLSKAAFTYLVMQLVGNKTIDLDKPVQDYLPRPLPEYESYKDLAGEPRYKKITARMLLSHSSGFPNLRWLNPDRKLNINFEPGSRYAYSGEGIMLLQLVVETVCHKPLQELRQERVFGPLGMLRTSMISAPRFENDLANGYDEWGRSLGPQQRKTAQAAGSMQTTVHDFALFLQAVANGTGLTKAARELMLTPQIQISSRRQFPTLDATTTDENKAIRLSYGLGWGLFWTPYGKAFFKEGHDDGFRHYTVVLDEPKDGIVIMTNSSNGEAIFKELLETLLRNTFTPIRWEGFTPYNDLPPRRPLPAHKEITVEPKLLDRLVGRYSVPGAVLRVTREDGHLMMQENDEAPAGLFPEQELRFFSKTSDDVVTFDIDSLGKVTQLVVHSGGRAISVKRIE
jgi:CubicO group peptidase (beta-lactamase class C family)